MVFKIFDVPKIFVVWTGVGFLFNEFEIFKTLEIKLTPTLAKTEKNAMLFQPNDFLAVVVPAQNKLTLYSWDNFVILNIRTAKW